MDWFLYDRDLHHQRVNSFQANVPFLSPIKTFGNFWCSDVFREDGNETFASNVLNKTPDYVLMHTN